MKKEYVKPYIAFESFQLDAAIASGCSEKDGKTPLNHGLDNCTLVDDSGPFDMVGYFGPACAEGGNGDNYETLLGGDNNDGYCYHGPKFDLYEMYLVS